MRRSCLILPAGADFMANLLPGVTWRTRLEGCLREAALSEKHRRVTAVCVLVEDEHSSSGVRCFQVPGVKMEKQYNNLSFHV